MFSYKKCFKMILAFVLSAALFIGCGISDPDSTQKADFIFEETVNTEEAGDTSEATETDTKQDNSEVPNKSSPSSSNESGSSGNTNATLTNEQKLVKGICDSIITSGMTDFQKALAIHDWLTFNIDYDQTLTHFYVEETLKDRTGVCQGYALCFKAMAEYAGLDVTYVTGTANNGTQTLSHAWNQVKIDGTWYNVDVTWDDPTYTNKPASDHSANNYNYFLISDSKIYKDHVAKSGKKTCSSDYSRNTIYKAALNSGKHGNAAYVSSTAELNEAVKKYMNAEVEGFWVWYYDTSVTSAYAGKFIVSSASSCSYPITLSDRYYPPEDGITKFYAYVPSMTEWNKTKVVTNAEEFSDYCNENFKNGIKTFKVRYETTDGNIRFVTNVEGCSIESGAYYNNNMCYYATIKIE